MEMQSLCFLDNVGLMDYLQQHPNVVEEYVLKHVSQNQIEKWIIRKSLKGTAQASSTGNILSDSF